MWVSGYIYYQETYEKFLTSIVWPFIQDALKKHYATQFFFIRYVDDKGFHISLRLKCEDKIQANKLKKHFRTIFHNYPIRFISYKPELSRYGGAVSMEIAHTQAEASSRAILSRLSENTQWNYTQSIGIALQLNLVLIHTMGLKRREAIIFLEQIFSSRFTSEEKQKNTSLFEKTLKKQRATVLPYLAGLWDALEKDQQFKEPWFTTWRSDMKIINTRHKKAQKNGQIQFAKNFSLLSLYKIYIHMTNNRLAIALPDEPFLTYILKESLETIHD